jgi:hypothetical protein
MTTTITGALGIDNIKAATGAVLQVVQGLYTNNFNTTSTSYVDTGLSASITPSSTSSKILVMVSQQGFKADSADSYYYNILRGSTQIGETRVQIHTTSQSSAGNYLHRLDSPSTTSSITYKTQVHSDSGNNIYFQWSTEGSSTITLMEIAG